MSTYSPNDHANHHRRRRLVVLGTVLVLAIITVLAVAVHHNQTSNSNGLWKIVHESCTVSMQINHNPAPCLSIDLTGGEAKGFAILKDKVGNSPIPDHSYGENYRY
jgi:CDP-diacylglycerol pyrophosphatase